MEAGQPYELFWRLTAREVGTILEGVSKSNFNDQSLTYYGAYMAGLLSQSYKPGKFPKYGENAPQFRGVPKRQQRDWRQLKALVETWNASAGGFDNRKKV